MVNVTFDVNEVNFWQSASFAARHGVDHFDLLCSAHQQGVLKSEETGLMEKFLRAFAIFETERTSQLYQDIFAEFIMNHYQGQHHFLEFGATDGLSLSNTASLERLKRWKGVLAEPSPQWHVALRYNRPKARIIEKCVWSESDKQLEFFVSDVGELSTLCDFTRSDEHSVPANTKERLKNGRKIVVDTISLNDIIRDSFEGICPDYISVDTEGSELEILSNLDFRIYRPKLLTVEHNFTGSEEKLDFLFDEQGYTRVFKDATAFDAWYVENTTLELVQN